VHGRVGELELREDRVDVLLDGGFRKEERLLDAGVGLALCHQSKNTAFTINGAAGNRPE
jgi:hypothetical protein